MKMSLLKLIPHPTTISGTKWEDLPEAVKQKSNSFVVVYFLAILVFLLAGVIQTISVGYERSIIDFATLLFVGVGLFRFLRSGNLDNVMVYSFVVVGAALIYLAFDEKWANGVFFWHF